MTFRYKKPLQIITLFLFICLANGYVFAFVADGNAPADSLEPKVLPAGILNAFDALSVRVNGNIAQDGMTILSGAEIKTSNNGGASINLRQLGKVELSSETSVKLVFTAKQIDLQVLSGQAKLTTYKGLIGVLTDADGKILKTDSSLEISSVGNSETSTKDTPLTVPAKKELFGLGLWGTVTAISGVISGTALAWVVANSDNASQSPISRVQP